MTALTDTSASELDSTNAKGSYVVDLTQAETNGNKLVFTGKSSTSNVAIVPQTIYTVPAAFGIAGGSSGGVMIAGTNAALTVTGAVQFQNAFNITGALTVGGGIDVINSTTNGPALSLLGNGTGEAIKATAGATGKAVSLISVANHSLFIKAVGSYKHGVHVESDTDGNAICFQATHTDVTSSTHFGHGMVGFSADIANGNAVMLRALYHGCGLALYGYDNESGFHIQGGATGPSMQLNAGTSASNAAAAIRVRGGPNTAAMQLVGGYGGAGTTACATIDITNENTTTDSHGIQASIVSGHCIYLNTDGASHSALKLTSTYGHTVDIDTSGASKHGVIISGGNSGTSDGVRINAGTGGVGMRLASLTVTGASTLTGAVSMGSTLTVTGTTTLAALSVSGTTTLNSLAVTNAVTVGSSFTITGGLVTNITGNLTGNIVGTLSTLTTYTGNTPQTGDAFARLGAPAGASVSADIAAVKTDTGNLVTRITSTLFTGITSLAQWLGLIAGKQTGNTTARTEVRATGAGSGTFDETTDSQEAIRDRGDAAWTTGGGGSAPSVAEIDAQLSLTHGAGSWESGGLGSGARTVTLTIERDDTDAALEGARVRVVKGAENYVGSTNASGVITFNLDDGTWTVSISLAGFTYSGTTLVVNGTETQTYQMTPSTITPSSVGQTTGYGTVYDETGVAAAGVTVTCQLISIHSSLTGVIGDTTSRSAVSDANGLVQFTGLLVGGTYELRKRSSTSTMANGFRAVIPPTYTDATYPLPPII